MDRGALAARGGWRRTTPTRDRYLNVAAVSYALAMWLLNSPSPTAPTFGSSDLWTLAAVVLVVAAGWLLARRGAPGRQRREGCLRRRIDVLDNHPVAE